MNAIIYDFKRSLFRISVIVTLILFAMVGLGMGYYIYHSTLSELPAYSYYNMNFVGVVSRYDNLVILKGYVFNDQGNPLPATVELLQVSKVVAIAHTNSSGSFRIQGKNATCVIVKHLRCEETSTLPVIHRVILNISMFYNYRGLGQCFMAFIFGVKNNIGKLIIVSGSNKGVANFTYYVKVYCSNSFHIRLYKVIKSCVINYSNYITISTIKVPARTVWIYVNATEEGPSSYYPIPRIEYIINKGLLSSSLIFTEFLSIIMIYLSYTFYARLIDSGSIEFIISRPITRAELYLIRLSSGILTAIVASVIFGSVFGLSFSLMIHYFTMYTVSILILMLLPILTFYYTLGFTLSNFIKSSTKTLGLSIVIFILTTVINKILSTILETNTLSIALYSINPISISYVASYLLTHFTLAEAPFNIGISIAVQLAWIIGLLVLGYLRFRKIDI